MWGIWCGGWGNPNQIVLVRVSACATHFFTSIRFMKR